MKRLSVAFLIAFLSTPAWADDEIPLDQVPEAARQTIMKHVADGTIEEIDRDVEGGKTVYEVEYRDANGAEFEMKVTEDGRLLENRPD